ncbi:uncharacterized protein C7orf31 homolog [Micropterus salmoides]|uniref:uncharacterized protein C7orf31 homolog n=1 Tax=Micropterus salmoides TaxID=27706 RepID=UPI0018EDCE87|nr:uncharacterized protein C7orf31 homolog [Micropterus salmoides]
MLKNLERTQWVTSYQEHYTGSGPANPLKIDDFKEKISDLTGMNSHTAPLRERSFPVFVPSKAKGGCRRRLGSCVVVRSMCSPDETELPNQGTASATINQHRPQEITVKHKEAQHANQWGHSESRYSSGPTEAQGAELSQEVLYKQQTESKSSVYEGRVGVNCKVQFDESPMQVSQSSQEANAAQITDTERPLDLYNSPLSHGGTEVKRQKSMMELRVEVEPSSKTKYFKARRNVSSLSESAVAKDLAGIKSHANLLSRAASEQEKLGQSRELPNPCILPRPPVLPGIHSVDRVGSVGGEGAAVRLLDLQNSFINSIAHRNFNSSITRAAVNLRDNVATGKKHNFYGINCYYLHG